MGMLFLNGGELYVHERAREMRLVQDAIASIGKNDLKNAMKYVYFVCDRLDNPYWGLPLRDRKRQVMMLEGLFDCNDKSPIGVVEKQIELLEGLDAPTPLRKWMDFYLRVQLTDIETIVERLRDELSKAMDEYISCPTHKEKQEIFKSIEEIEMLLKKKQLEAQSDGSKMSTQYLFELPEEVKPHHLKI